MNKENGNKNIESQLKKIRKAKFINMLLFIGFIPIGLGVVITEFFFPYSLIPYAVLCLAYSSYTALLICPRCGGYFFWDMTNNRKFGYQTISKKHCLNCNQPIKKHNKNT